MKLLLSLSIAWTLFFAATAQSPMNGEELEARWKLDALTMYYDNPENLEDEASIAKYQNKIAMRFVAPPDVPMWTGVYQTCPGALQGTPMSEGITTTSSAQRMGDNNNVFEEIFQITPDIVNYGPDTWTDGTNEEGQKIGTAKFCYAIQLPNGDQDVVNYMQMVISITYLLQGEFSVDTFSTQAVDILLGSQNDSDRVATIESCSQAQDGAYSPGELFCVRVCSDDPNFYVTEILQLTASNPTNTGLSQDLKGLADQAVFSEDGKCRKAEFILNAIFFPSGTDTAQVTLSGTCAFNFDTSTGRRRRLQANGQEAPLPTAKFTTEVTLDSGETPAPDSAAAGVMVSSRNPMFFTVSLLVLSVLVL